MLLFNMGGRAPVRFGPCSMQREVVISHVLRGKQNEWISLISPSSETVRSLQPTSVLRNAT